MRLQSFFVPALLALAAHAQTAGFPAGEILLYNPFVSCGSGLGCGAIVRLDPATVQAATPFHGVTLCVEAPVKRAPATVTGGNPPPNDGSGAPSIDMNLFAVGGLGGTPLPARTVSGTVVNCQWWGRDPGFAAPNNTQLWDGMQYSICP